MTKKILLTLTILMHVVAGKAQMADPVHFSSELKILNEQEGEIIFKAVIDAGWHVYSTDLGNGGPIEASLTVNKMEGAECVGKLSPRGQEIKTFDQLFGMEVRYFEQHATFVQKIRFTKQQYDIDCTLEYGACNPKRSMLS